MACLGKSVIFLWLKTHARLQLVTQLYLPHQRDSYHDCRADWILLTYPQPQIVCVSKSGSHFNPTLEQDPACTITHQTLIVAPWSQKIILQNYFWSTRAHKFKIGKPSTPPFLSHSKNKIMPTFGLDPSYQAVVLSYAELPHNSSNRQTPLA